jgi:hypothetical protein
MLAPFRGLDPRLKHGVEVVEGPPNTKKLPFKVFAPSKRSQATCDRMGAFMNLTSDFRVCFDGR